MHIIFETFTKVQELWCKEILNVYKCILLYADHNDTICHKAMESDVGQLMTDTATVMFQTNLVYMTLDRLALPVVFLFGIFLNQNMSCQFKYDLGQLIFWDTVLYYQKCNKQQKAFLLKDLT